MVSLALSVATFIAYYLDKRAAQSGAWRTQESALHAMALFGGWPGALIAQQMFRHKTKKQPFQAIFWLTVAGNVVVTIMLMAASVSAGAPGL